MKVSQKCTKIMCSGTDYWEPRCISETAGKWAILCPHYYDHAAIKTCMKSYVYIYVKDVIDRWL